MNYRDCCIATAFFCLIADNLPLVKEEAGITREKTIFARALFVRVFFSF